MRRLPARLRTRPSLQLLITLVLALIIAYGLQRWMVGFFRVPTASMSRTLLPGDRLLAARFWYAIERPSRGDIVSSTRTAAATSSSTAIPSPGASS